MKQICFCLLAILTLSACRKDQVKERYSFYRPVYQTKENVRANIRNSPPQDIQVAGKLVWKDKYIFLNDLDRGVHIIDINDPANPKQIAFINIPGCVDLAVNGNILYADCYTDLVAIDISNPQQVVAKQFVPGVFPNRVYTGLPRPDTSKIIINWIRVDTVINKNFEDSERLNIGGIMFFSASSLAMGSSLSTAGVGITGSMARFAATGPRLYTVGTSDLKVFNTSVPALPTFVRTVALNNGGIETIFPYKDKLFIGSTTGMYVYSAQNPDQPQQLCQFTHARTCDPVVADDSLAYVTLRGNGRCGGAANQLDVVDISNITSPKAVRSYPLKSPGGLSKDGNLLFICDGKDGLKVFDATSPTGITQLKQFPGFESYDVIARGGIAIVVATDGLRLFDYTIPALAREVGKISITTK